MLSAFAAVGVRAFDLTLTDIEGKKISFKPNRQLGELRRTIGRTLQEAGRDRHNVIIRPRKTSRAELVQLDDLDTTAAQRIAPYAFMVLCTSPGNFQTWIAVTGAGPDFARRLRKGAGADPSASGATRISGSLNFKTKYAPAFPRVEITHAKPGQVVSAGELESAGFVAPLEQPPPRVSPRVAGPYAGRRKWPDYARCVAHAPPVHQGDRPDISRADFSWCLIAIDWGWSIEDTARQLMEQSSKAREPGEGERYALLTAQNAAAAVRRRRPVKSSLHPG
jgi:hypothetical protein